MSRWPLTGVYFFLRNRPPSRRPEGCAKLPDKSDWAENKYWGSKNDCSDHNEHNDGLIFESSDDLIFHFTTASPTDAVKL